VYKLKNKSILILLFIVSIILKATPAKSQDATLVNIIDTTIFGSSDPSGLTVLPFTGDLLVSDSEIEETPFFQGNNIFEITTTGNLLSTYSTLEFSNEPTGVTFNTVTGTLFISDDTSGRLIFEVDPLTFEVLSTFSVLDFGSDDPEGITFNSTNGNLFIADGLNRQIYEVTTSGILVSSFSLPNDLRDPEGIYYDDVSGNLFIICGNDTICNITTSGIVVNEIDIRSFGVVQPKGITFAPSSDPGDDSNILNMFIADYGLDEVMDGRLFEISTNGGGPTNLPPDGVIDLPSGNLTINVGDSVKFNGTGSDPDNNFPLSFLWQFGMESGILDSTEEDPGFVQFNIPGTYTITFRVTDAMGFSDPNPASRIITVLCGDNCVNFSAVADTTVISSRPNRNYGDRTTISIDGSPTKIAYLRFNVTGMSGIQSAILKLDVLGASVSGGTIFSMTDNSWDEHLVTYDTRPIIDGIDLGTIGVVNIGDIAELDVTASISGNGPVSYAIVSNDNDGVQYGSRENSAYSPILTLTTDGSGSNNTPPQIDNGPTATPNQIMSNETSQLSVVASDIDGDPLTFTWSTLTGEGTITGTGDTVTYNPPSVGVQQTFTVTVVVSDGQGGIVTGTVDVTVLPIESGMEMTFTAAADAAVHSNNPSANYGFETTLSVDGSPTRIAYLRFEVTGVTGAVQSASIRLNCVNGSLVGGTIHSLSDINWGEGTITYDTQPIIDGPALFAQGQVDVGDVVEMDVTPAIGGDGIYSFAIVSNNNNGVRYGAREDLINQPILRVIADGGGSGNTPPQIDNGPTATPNQILSNETSQLSVVASDIDGDPLTFTWSTLTGEGTITGTGDTVTYNPPAVTVQQTFTVTVVVSDGQGGIATRTVNVTVLPVGGGTETTFTSVADAAVHSNDPAANYGFETTLSVDGSPTRIAYLRFEVTGITGAVQSARIRLNCVNGSAFGGTIHSLSDIDWVEGTITYDTQPVIDGPALFAQGQVDEGDVVEMDVTPAISGDGIYSFAIVSNINNGVRYRSREDTISPPALIIISESN
jgi:hypothetical protein